MKEEIGDDDGRWIVTELERQPADRDVTREPHGANCSGDMSESG